MSTAVFPVLPGLGWEVVRTTMWNNTITENVSGKRTGVGHWTYPRLRWELSYDILRADPAHHEWQDLQGFFDQRRGRLDTFLFEDVNDKTVTAQAIGTGTGAISAFQLQRTFGGASAPVFAPHTVTGARVAGVDPGGWSAAAWGTATPGVLTFLSAPANGAAIVADFSYYWPCRFADDTLTFNNFMTQLWSGKKIIFESEK